MGQISENELLQLKLSALKAASNLTKEQSSLNGAMFRLRSFLGLSESDSIDPIIPEMLNYPVINYQDVLAKAQENNPFAQNIRHRQLEADYEVAQAKGAQREIDLFASVGYTGQEQYFKSAYQILMDYQIVQVGVKIPHSRLGGKAAGGTRESGGIQPGSDCQPVETGADEFQSRYFPVGGAIQQPDGTVAHRPRGRRNSATAVQDFGRIVYDR